MAWAKMPAPFKYGKWFLIFNQLDALTDIAAPPGVIVAPDRFFENRADLIAT